MDRDEWYRRYGDDIRPRKHRDERIYPKVTLSARTELRKNGSKFPVLKQRSYTGKKPVIRSTLANTPCSDFGIQGLLEKLNTTLHASHTLSPGEDSILEAYILKEFDFGTAYAYLRPFWNYHLINFVHELLKRKVQDQKMRQDVLINDRIIFPHVPPRRVWDLYSNRVVPWWVARQKPLWAISHAWMDDGDRKDIMTPINGREWPVPIPKGTSLDLIRIEMLNLGAEYVWLDVLCLRQKGGIREDLHEEEWKVDVPTIGSVYHKAERVVCYLSGLGQPLRAEAIKLDNKRCWFRRAWTLQEISANSIIGGDTGDVDEKLWAEEKLSSLWRKSYGLYDVLSEMQKRESTNPTDKVAGMAYLLLSDSIPAYYEKQSDEDAWIALLDAAESICTMALLFLYPQPGDGPDGTKRWRPSWKQIIHVDSQLPSTDANEGPFNEFASGKMDAYNNGYIIEAAAVKGLSEGDLQGRTRRGTLVVKDDTGIERELEIVARHQYPIPDDSYTLLGTNSHSDPKFEFESKVSFWVVGRRLEDQKLEKSSVFQMDMNALTLVSEGIATRARTTYLA